MNFYLGITLIALGGSAIVMLIKAIYRLGRASWVKYYQRV